ncbi:unnamed protein product [Nesidiocoris tenuis]|uniref:Uncharacterized protein n=1 Tax=Nesidiocoris tenuis TaxID=355587 RepID=A0A6H5GYZ5_9HEMI|nr:unnamed protein product [Nesidiocoris tenuis]
MISKSFGNPIFVNEIIEATIVQPSPPPSPPNDRRTERRASDGRAALVSVPTCGKGRGRREAARSKETEGASLPTGADRGSGGEETARKRRSRAEREAASRDASVECARPVRRVGSSVGER